MFGRKKRDGGQERTASGQPVLRHQAVDRPFQGPAPGDPARRRALEEHYRSHLGECETVWHEIVSDLVHIDVYTWPPTPERPMHTFATVGMSDVAMTVPDGAIESGAARFAELVVCLPPAWPVPSDSHQLAPWDDPDHYFPIRWLKQLARLPHEYRTWLGFGHSIPNGDPPEPLATTTRLCGWVLLPPMTLPPSFRRVDLDGDDALDVFGIVAVLPEELDAKLAHGTEALFAGFDRYRVNELLAVDRPSSLLS